MSTYAFCFVQPTDGFPDRAYGPQGKMYTIVGTTSDGRSVGVAEVYPSELAIIASPAHRGEYLGATWNEVMAGPHADAIDWMVQVEDPENRGQQKLVREREAAGGEVARTALGNPLRRPPVPAFGAEQFDPDYLPAVGTVRVLSVEGANDRVQVVRTGADGVPAWYDLQTAPAAEEKQV